MEASETAAAAETNGTAAVEENKVAEKTDAADVGSDSSEEPTPPVKDGSVISAMTDPVSLEGPPIPALITEEAETEEPELLGDVPKQVILPDEEDRASDEADLPNGGTPPPPSSPPRSNSPGEQEEETTLLVTTTPIRSNPVVPEETVSLPERPAPSVKAVRESSNRSAASEDDAATAVHGNSVTIMDKINDADDYIRSPEVQNAIVERSPGGRYVRFMEKLGSGASKDVYRAYDTQEGIEVAWNVVNLSGVPKNERNRIVNEVRLLERLHHHNIISFHGSWVNRERQEVNFVTEILSSGTLKSFINKVQVIRWKIAKRWAVQILKGLEYLHAQDPPVIHRDLKCENIFINGTSGDLRIGDLGLSTVHRNGRVLSVLGTPEFMAPDMYEENSYDEKVDVYAFGMCMLEIFTQEIPYSECNNPAQIYKKVSAGEPPEVLSRLQSKHARDFVLLCLGYRNEDGEYIRPSVAELLQHPFLVKRGNDDDEVVVEPPLRERTIAEVDGESSSTVPITKRVQLDASPNATRNPLQKADSSLSGDKSPPPARKRLPSTASSSPDEEDGDRFEEMQESEITMRKVKVLMGRGQELEEEEQADDDGSRAEEKSLSTDRTADSSVQAGPSNEQVQQQQHQQSPALQYLVAAAVIENQNPNEPLYADDILKLVVRLPVDGQTQNVQFDFHLVEDDPIQVAKEMVQELGIPQGAVLEISETISGLARTARMNQEKHAGRIQNAQGQIQSQYSQGMLMQSGQHVQQHPGQPVQQQQQGVMATDPSQFQQQQQSGQPALQIQQQGATSQHDPSQYQQSVQPPVPQGQHMHQHGGIPVQQQDPSQYQQPIGQQMQHQGAIPGGLPQQQEHSQYQQGMQQASNPGQQVHQGGQAPLNVPQRGQMVGGVQQEQSQYQQHSMQHQGHGMQHGGMPNQYQMAQISDMQQNLQQQPPQLQQQVSDYSVASGSQPQMHHQKQPIQYQAAQISDMSQNLQQQQPPQQQQQVSDYAAASGSQPQIQQQKQPIQRQHSSGGTEQHQAQDQKGRHHAYASASGGGYGQQNVVDEVPVQQQPQMQSSVPMKSNAATLQQQGQVLQQSATPASQPPQVYTTTSGQAAVSATSHVANQAIPAQYQPASGALAPSSQMGVASQNGSTTQRPPTGRVPLVTPQQQQPLPPQGPGRPEGSAVPPPPQGSIMNSRAAAAEQSHPSIPESNSSSPKVSQRSTSTTSERDSFTNGSRQASVSDADSDDDDGDGDEEVSEELRKLDEDFEKNLQRAKKVFYNRMDNLQRSQVEREAQHQKTLEKHEKERAEFEKRLAQEEEQQNKRIEQLQREWDKRRETVALHKRKHHGGRGPGNLTSSMSDVQEAPTSGGLPSSGHLRSTSTVSSTFSLSPATSAHKSTSDSISSGISPSANVHKGPTESAGSAAASASGGGGGGGDGGEGSNVER